MLRFTIMSHLLALVYALSSSHLQWAIQSLQCLLIFVNVTKMVHTVMVTFHPERKQVKENEVICYSNGI